MLNGREAGLGGPRVGLSQAGLASVSHFVRRAPLGAADTRAVRQPRACAQDLPLPPAEFASGRARRFVGWGPGLRRPAPALAATFLGGSGRRRRRTGWRVTRWRHKRRRLGREAAQGRCSCGETSLPLAAHLQHVLLVIEVPIRRKVVGEVERLLMLVARTDALGDAVRRG